jgi:DNA-binding NarL/FixJ family response regulator
MAIVDDAKKPIRVFLVDDHELVRAGIRALLAKITGIEVTGEAGDGRAALEWIEAQRSRAMLPDVVLMDILMPELNGLEATARLKQQHPSVHVLVLSMNTSAEYVAQALRAGASGYLRKNVAVDQLEAAIRAVAGGETYLCSRVSKIVVEEYLRSAAIGANSLERLSPRQREILQLIAEGCTTKQIAQRLKIGTSTVETHRGQLMDTLDIHDIASLARYAVRMGLVAPDA